MLKLGEKLAVQPGDQGKSLDSVLRRFQGTWSSTWDGAWPWEPESGSISTWDGIKWSGPVKTHRQIARLILFFFLSSPPPPPPPKKHCWYLTLFFLHQPDYYIESTLTSLPSSRLSLCVAIGSRTSSEIGRSLLVPEWSEEREPRPLTLSFEYPTNSPTDMVVTCATPRPTRITSKGRKEQLVSGLNEKKRVEH